MKKLLWLVISLCLIFTAGAAAAGSGIDLSCEEGTVSVIPAEIGSETWLFLPSFASKCSGLLNGAELPETPGAGETFSVTDAEGNEVHIMRSSGLRTVFLYTDDPAEHGREWLENSYMHEAETTGSILVIGVHGETDYRGTVQKLRGRGNSTWYYDKRSWHIKLNEKADLLKTGLSEEAARTWVLLADTSDLSLARTRIGMGLSMEMGLDETARCEPVDLYFDGEYRGTYFLCEKVQMAKGRVEGTDYDKIMNKLNPGNDAEEIAEALTPEGRFANVSAGALDGGSVSAGTYLLELENSFTRSDPCWFSIGEENCLAFKSPEIVSADMLQYVSGLFEAGRRALTNGGTDPETGLTSEEVFDTESFSRALLISEFLYNIDAFRYSSTFWVLPEGSSRFRSGPLWDFETTFRASGEMLNRPRGNYPLSEELYSSPAVQSAMRRIWAEELRPLILNTLLGKEETAFLKPLSVWKNEIAASESMNRKLWAGSFGYGGQPGDALDKQYDAIREYMSARVEWMDRILAPGTEEMTPEVLLWGEAVILQPEDTLQVGAYALTNTRVTDVSAELISEADEDSYARYRAEVTLEPINGTRFSDDLSVRFGNAALTPCRNEDGTVTVCFTFSDPGYKPVWYEDEDYGLVFSAKWYAANTEDLPDGIADDEEELIRHFVENGMPEGLPGNAYFRPADVRSRLSDIREMLGTEWESYYSEYMSWGYEDWPASMGIRFDLSVKDSAKEPENF